ncbi:MAG TPA: hypothetical protein P5013_02980 [Methanoregula sp.]|nr:hypothetical protein [Methanoregula sp.]
MKSSVWASVLFFSLLGLWVLVSGCTEEPEEILTPLPTTMATTPRAVPKMITTQETPLIPPPPPSRVPMDGIGKYLGSVEFSGSGNEVTGIRVERNAYYRFTVTNTSGKALKLFITNWNGDKTIDIFDNTRTSSKIHTSLELFKGNYYFWTITDGAYSFQVSYEP